jgi:1-acyl-sn-glycerol-3-phosphate acyltransferase
MKGWVRTALWFRFRKVSIVFHVPPPMREGAILAGNHQNAILDSITLAACSPRIPYTLSRASLFDNPVARWFLGSLRMLPIYRFRDGFGKMRRNAEIFEQFVKVLTNDEWLLMFPEGSHLLRYTLRPLQKGIARIAFAAQEAQSWEREIPIIPVGLQYESHTTFGSRLLIQFGPPVSSLAYKNLHAGNPKEAERALTAELFEEMKRLLVLPPQDDQSYESAVQRWTLNKGRFPDLMDQFRADREIVSGGDEPRGERALERHPWRKLVGYALSVPGIVIHLPVILVSLAWERAFVWDEHLVPAARFAAGLLLTPLWYMLALALWHSRGGSIPSDVLLLGLMPLSLWLWSRLWHWTR